MKFFPSLISIYFKWITSILLSFKEKINTPDSFRRNLSVVFNVSSDFFSLTFQPTSLKCLERLALIKDYMTEDCLA